MCCANFSKPATGSNTMHTGAVNATTSASGARNSERCDAQTQREWQLSVLSRKTLSL